MVGGMIEGADAANGAGWSVGLPALVGCVKRARCLWSWAREIGCAHTLRGGMVGLGAGALVVTHYRGLCGRRYSLCLARGAVVEVPLSNLRIFAYTAPNAPAASGQQRRYPW